MPNFPDLAAFERELGRFEAEFERSAKRKITRQQAEKAQRIAAERFRGRLGGDERMSGWEPTLDTQVRELRDGAALLTPTKTGAGPITVLFQGRNRGETGRLLGPGILRSGLTARTKSGAVRKVRARQSRRWNGTTDPMMSPEDLRKPFDKAALEIAEREYRRAQTKHFDVD